MCHRSVYRVRSVCGCLVDGNQEADPGAGSRVRSRGSCSETWTLVGAKDMKDFIWELGKLGFCWQFITLGGLHSNAYISDLFARAFATEGMKAYVELIQKKEREIGCDVLTHQKVCLFVSVGSKRAGC